MIREGRTWSEVEDVAEAMLDKNKVNIKAKVVNSMHPHGHNFDAVVEQKKKTDEKDPYLVWKINNRHFNNGIGSFVFKTSKEKAAICVQMDKDKSEHPLSKEFCFLDAVDSRCQGYKTLTLWVWHPALNELVNLATMESETESSLMVQLFWNKLNKVTISLYISSMSTRSIWSNANLCNIIHATFCQFLEIKFECHEKNF